MKLSVRSQVALVVAGAVVAAAGLGWGGWVAGREAVSPRRLAPATRRTAPPRSSAPAKRSERRSGGPSGARASTAACVGLLEASMSQSWQHPTATPAQFEPWATPALAAQLAGADRLTPGQIESHYVSQAYATPGTPERDGTGWKVDAAVVENLALPGGGETGITSNWSCQVISTPAGWRVASLSDLGA